MSAGSLLFAISSALCLGGALIVVLASSPIRSAMGLLATIGGIAGLFLRLNAQFLAAIQLLVYAGAVVILFVFVVMLLGPSAGVVDKAPPKTLVSRGLSAGAMALMGILGFALIFGGRFHRFPRVSPLHGSVEAVGGAIFNQGLVAFELTTALLIVAVVGAIAVARTKPSAKPTAKQEHATLRLFHGPLTSRDAERPLTKGGLSAGRATAAASSSAPKETV